MSSGRPRSFITALRMRRTGASAISPFFTLFGMKPISAALTNRFIFGACAARAEDVEHVADAVADRVDEVEALAVQIGLRCG